MAKNYNNSISDRTRQLFNSKVGDMIGSQVGELIVPTIDVSPRGFQIIRSATATGTIFTTSTDKKFYLQSIQGHVLADPTATDDSSIAVVATINGALRTIFLLRNSSVVGVGLGFMTGVANSISFTIPILIDPNTNITLSANTSSGNGLSQVTLFGFEVE